MDYENRHAQHITVAFLRASRLPQSTGCTGRGGVAIRAAAATGKQFTDATAAAAA